MILLDRNLLEFISIYRVDKDSKLYYSYGRWICEQDIRSETQEVGWGGWLVVASLLLSTNPRCASLHRFVACNSSGTRGEPTTVTLCMEGVPRWRGDACKWGVMHFARSRTAVFNRHETFVRYFQIPAREKPRSFFSIQISWKNARQARGKTRLSPFCGKLHRAYRWSKNICDMPMNSKKKANYYIRIWSLVMVRESVTSARG